MDVLVIGRNAEVLETVKEGLIARGITVDGTTAAERASIDFDARDFAVVAFGGAVGSLLRETLRSEFKRQNPDVILLDTFAPVAVPHITAALRGDTGKREFASRCEITEGDGSYLMLAQEIVTCLQEGYKLNIVLLDNHGFSSIGGLSRACGNQGMGTEYRYRQNGKLDGEAIRVDFVANAKSLGACAVRAQTRDDLRNALIGARQHPETSVIVIETAYDKRVPSYESWWDVPIAEVSESDAVRGVRSKYVQARQKERIF